MLIALWILKSWLKIFSLKSTYADHQTAHRWHQPASPRCIILYFSWFELRMGETLSETIVFKVSKLPFFISVLFYGLFQLSAYAPYVHRCALSSIFKTRELAARALVPLIAPNQHAVLLEKLITTAASTSVLENYRHGLLLQVLIHGF